MAHNRQNDEYDLSQFDDLLSRGDKGGEETSDGFDFFNFSSADLHASDISRVSDDLDLDSFLDFDHISAPAPVKPEPKPETAKPVEPTAEELALQAQRQQERSHRRARRDEVFAELFGTTEKSETSEPEKTKAEPEMDEADRFFANYGKTDAPLSSAPAAKADEQSEDAQEEYFREETDRRRGFFTRFLKSDDPQEDDAPLGELEKDKPSKLSRMKSRFSREHAAADEDAPESDERPVGERISFFSRLTPEKEKFQALIQSQKSQNDHPRRGAIVAADNASLSERMPREPARGEMLVYDSELDDLDYIDGEDMPEVRDYLPIRFRRYGRSGIGGGLMYALFVISLSVVLACFAWLCAADVLALSKDEVHAVVVVQPYVAKEGDLLNEDGEAVDEDGNVITCDIAQVAQSLKDGEIINFKFLFQLFSKLSHAYYKIDPGTYDVSTALDYRALITEMQTGSDSQAATKITFPEGYRMEQIFQLLDDNDVCDYDDLMDAAANHDFNYSWLDEPWYYEAEGDPTRLEGYLFPDTYEFYQGEGAVNVINRFLLRFHGLITQDMYQQAENLGITLHDAVIIASLIEREAGAEDDRSNFSSVIYNRLSVGMPLQLDSTINYINNTSTFNISTADTQTDSPYNTYLYTGLPRGAICNAGSASLNAALNPNSTDYWYWYAYDGLTYFFEEYDDFEAFGHEHPYN